MPTATSTTHAASAKATTPNASSTGVHAATEAAVHSARNTAAMHASAEAGLAAEGVLVYHTAMFKTVECAGVAAWRQVRRDESTVGAMIGWFGSIALGATAKAILTTSKTSAGTKTLRVVNKGVAP